MFVPECARLLADAVGQSHNGTKQGIVGLHAQHVQTLTWCAQAAFCSKQRALADDVPVDTRVAFAAEDTPLHRGLRRLEVYMPQRDEPTAQDKEISMAQKRLQRKAELERVLQL